MSTRYRFKIWYANERLQAVSSLLEKLDLGMEGFCIQETYELVHKDEVEVSYLKELITQSMEKADCKVYKIEGGKYE